MMKTSFAVEGIRAAASVDPAPAHPCSTPHHGAAVTVATVSERDLHAETPAA
jgi:hypothetical protein